MQTCFPDYHCQWRVNHCNADMFSRLPVESKSPAEDTIYSIQIAYLPVSADDIRIETKNDLILKNVLLYLKDGKWPAVITPEYQPYYNIRQELFIEDNVILWGLKVVIPLTLQKKVLVELHNQNPGIVRMKALSRIHAWFPKIDLQIEEMVMDCKECAKVVNEPPKSLVHRWSWAAKPMDRIHIDYFEFEAMFFLIMVDSYSKWMEVKEMKKTNSFSTIRTLKHWFASLGLPNQLVTDNGPQFTSLEFGSYMKANGMNHLRSAAYHQSSNGQAERYVQTVKKGLKSNTKTEGPIQEKVDSFLMAYRSTQSTVSGESPSKLLYGREMQTILDCMKPKLEITKKRESSAEYPIM